MLVFQARKARHPFNLSRNASYWTQPEFRLTCCCSHRRRSSEIPSSLWVRSCSDPCTVRSSSCYLRNLQQTMASSPDWASATSFSQLRRICKKYLSNHIVIHLELNVWPPLNLLIIMRLTWYAASFSEARPHVRHWPFAFVSPPRDSRSWRTIT